MISIKNIKQNMSILLTWTPGMLRTMPQNILGLGNSKAVTWRQQTVKGAKKLPRFQSQIIKARIISEYGLFKIAIQVLWRFRRKFKVFRPVSLYVPPPSTFPNVSHRIVTHRPKRIPANALTAFAGILSVANW